MKKILSVILTLALATTAFTACSGSNSGTSSTEGAQTEGGFDTSNAITVVSREDGSGTRSAFVELTGVEQKDADGNKEDKTTVEAVIATKTDVMLTNVANNEYAIGYVSMGSLNNTVKAVKVGGVEATAENVKNGTYTIARPLNIATKGEVSEVAQDFIKFITSKNAQEICADGYISVYDDAEEYTASGLEGKVTVAGSSSVYPLMEKLKEAYVALNPNVEIEVQSSDSTAGMTAAMEGACDIGMASRELKESELEQLTPTVVAMDGIAVIVNNANTIEDLTTEQIMKIYTGEVTAWDGI